jgi:hypothetical protein
MKKSDKREGKKKLDLRKESLRQLDQNDLNQVAGGWYRTCMGTWATYYP